MRISVSLKYLIFLGFLCNFTFAQATGHEEQSVSLEDILIQNQSSNTAASNDTPVIDSSIAEILSQEQRQDLVSAQSGVIPVIRRPVLAFRVLNKASKVTETFTVDVGAEIAYETLTIKVSTCQERPPEYVPETGAFIQVFENNNRRIFSGWMFVSAPSISAFEHPLYDIYILSCLNSGEKFKEKRVHTARSTLVPPLPERPAALTTPN